MVVVSGRGGSGGGASSNSGGDGGDSRVNRGCRARAQTRELQVGPPYGDGGASNGAICWGSERRANMRNAPCVKNIPNS